MMKFSTCKIAIPCSEDRLFVYRIQREKSLHLTNFRFKFGCAFSLDRPSNDVEPQRVRTFSRDSFFVQYGKKWPMTLPWMLNQWMNQNNWKTYEMWAFSHPIFFHSSVEINLNGIVDNYAITINRLLLH